jgi:hypothetical protein
MKLLDILDEVRKAYKLIDEPFDKETMSQRSKVVYDPVYNLDKATRQMYKDFRDTVKAEPKDAELRQMRSDFIKLHRRLLKHLEVNYPEL